MLRAWMIVACLIAGCSGADDGEGSVRARYEARLAEVQADDAAARAALEGLPAPTESCEVPAGLVGATILGVGAEGSSVRVAAFVEGTEGLRERADSISAAGADQWLGRYSGDDWQRHELYLVATEYQAPALDTGTYDPGRVVGRAVVWDHVEDRALCARDVDVVPEDDTPVTISTGSGEVASRTSALAALERRFPEAVLRVARRQLEAPPALEEAPAAEP